MKQSAKAKHCGGCDLDMKNAPDRIYYIDFYNKGKRVRERIGTSKKLAETTLRKRKVEIAEGRYLNKKKEIKIRFKDFASEYRKWAEVNNKSFEKSKRWVIERLCKVFGDKLLAEITAWHVEKYKAARKQEMYEKKQIQITETQTFSLATINRELACLQHMFSKAIEWGKAETNPVSKVNFFKESKGRLRFLLPQEINRLIDCCPPHIKPIVITAVCTGLRKGEIVHIRWEDIDFKNRIIYIGNTKNGEKRETPINDRLTETLKSINRNEVSPYVFCDKDGKPYYRFGKSFATALSKAGIKDFRFHDLRHTFASNLVMEGIDLATVRELLGHKSIEMTLRYSHLSPDHRSRAVKVMDALMGMDTNMDTRLNSIECRTPKSVGNT
jgi:integrase